MTFYRLWIRLEGTDLYLIWHSNDKDGVLVEHDSIIAFETLDRAESYARELGIEVRDERPIMHDLDGATAWADMKPPDDPDCDLLLTVWNLFRDVAESVVAGGDLFKKRAADAWALYEKIFRGANLPVLSNGECQYVPRWTRDEIEALQRVVVSGRQLLKAKLAIVK